MLLVVKTDDSPYILFLKKSDRDRTNKVYDLLNFFIAGEQENKKLLFYLLLSCYHPDLICFIIYRGDSSAGKNYLVNSVLKLFPQEHILLFDSATAAALNYDQALAGVKVIYLRELSEQATVVEFLKNFYNEEGYIHKETVRDPKSKELHVKTHYHNRKGVITTLSFEKVQVDLINRSWVLNPDQSYDQTSAVIDYHLDVQKNLIDREIHKKEVMQDCYFIAQAIKNLDFGYDVYVAYLDRLRALFPSDYLNVRRDVSKLINLIKIITLWNQKNRRIITIGDKKYLFAEYFDLKEALEISQKLYINLVLHIDETKKNILDFMEYMELKDISRGKKEVTEFFADGTTAGPKIEEVNRWYSISEVYDELRGDKSLSRRTVQRKLEELYYDGYLFRDKVKGKWAFKKLKEYDLIESIKLPDIMESIIGDIEQKYIYYSGQTEEMLKNE